MKDMIETWEISNRINLYLLDNIEETSLNDVPAGSKGRNVGEQFAHIHNVRLMWLKVAVPDIFASQIKIEKEDALSKKSLQRALKESSAAVSKLLEKGFAEGKIKGFKPHPAAFLGYLVAHESHHRGQIILSLKQSGHKLDPKIIYGMWEWGSR